jgi:hypothetical protein
VRVIVLATNLRYTFWARIPSCIMFFRNNMMYAECAQIVNLPECCVLSATTKYYISTT